MKIMKYLQVFLTAALFAVSAAAYADDSGENLIYIGAGSAQSGDKLKSSSTPISLGYLRISNASDVVWGFDYSGEGTMLDSTWGMNSSVKQANAFNILIGRNISKNENSRFDAALLLGGRETFSTCPSSYLGYQCYADTAPSTSYKLNYGALVTFTYKSYMLGLRATGESAQAIIGYRF